MWSQKNLFAHLTASCYRSDGSRGAWDSAWEVAFPSTILALGWVPAWEGRFSFPIRLKR
jgi:hypothetical protein